MQLTHLTLLLSVTLVPILSQTLTPNAVTTLLQSILSPKNTEQVVKILSTAANKKRAVPNVAGTVNKRYAIVDNAPRTVSRAEAPNRFAQLVQRPQDMCVKKDVVMQNPNNVIVQNGNQMVVPKKMVVQRRAEIVLPKNVIIQNGGEVTLPRNVIFRQNEMPKRVIEQSNDFVIRVPQMRTPEVVQQRVLISQPKVAEYGNVPQQKVLIRNENPFLPAASPVSAFTASSSSNLPPAAPKSRGQFLRKIPIPPPTL